MPIQIVCPTCGKKLQVGDQYAGRKVSCPGCKTVLTAPGTPAAPAASPPPPPATATPKPPPKAAPAAPPPPAPAPVEEEEAGDFSFGSSRAKAEAKSEDEDDSPKSKPWKKDSKTKDDEPPRKGRAGKKEKDKGRDDDDDDDDFDRPKRSGRSGSRDESEKASAGAWTSFGGGSAMAKWGMWIEFLGFAVALVMVGSLIKSAIDHPGGAAEKLEDYGGPFMLAPFFLGSAIGTLLVWLGRARMLSIPAGTGAKKVFLGAFILTLVRLLCVFGAAIMIISAGAVWGSDKSDAAGKMAIAMMLWFAGIPFWALADLSSIPGMAIVGGAIPNVGLRRRAGWVTFVLQLLVIGYLVVVILMIVAGKEVELSDLRGGSSADSELRTTNPRTGTPTTVTRSRSSGSSGKDNIKSIVTAAQSIALLLQLAYTALYTSLYAAGARAVVEARDAEDAAQDDEI